MDIADAFQIVLDLARQNILDFDDGDEELVKQRREQEEACDMVEDFVVNQLGDD